MLTPREVEEYKALRDTIRERGTTRFWVVVAGMAGWGALALATAEILALPAASVLPLLFLATAFEVVFALHAGVERIGRYIQVFFEEEGSGWEHTAMALGQTNPGGGTDPLFANHFRIAAVLNFVPAAFARPMPVELGLVGVIHVLFIARVALARRQAAGQRNADLERFRAIRGRQARP
jgi:hypothetical protein